MAWSFLDSSGTQIIALCSFLVIARFLTPQALGTVAVAMIVVDLVRTTLIESIAVAVQAKPAPNDEDYNGCFILILGTSLLGALLIFSLSFEIRRVYDIPGLPAVLRTFALVCACQGLSRTHEAWLSRNRVFRSLAIRSMTAALAGASVGISLAASGFGPFAMVWGQIAANLVSMTALWTLTPWRPGLMINRDSIISTVRFAIPLSLTALVGFCNANLDVLFVTWFYGSKGAGFYGLAKRITNSASMMIASAANRVFFSSMADTQGDKAEAASRMMSFVAQTASLTAPLFTGIAILSPALIHILFGAKWGSSGNLLTIMCVTGFLTTIGIYNHSVMLTFGKPIWQTYLTIVYAVTNVVIFYSVGRAGLDAIAIGFVARALLLYPLSIAGAARLIPISIASYLKASAEPLVGSLVMVIAFTILSSRAPLVGPWLLITAFIAIGPLTYDATMFIFGRSLLREAWAACSRGKKARGVAPGPH